MTFESFSPSAASSAKYLKFTVDHPQLGKTDAASIQIFLQTFDQYCNKIQQHARQLSVAMTILTATVQPVNLKFCCNVEMIKSLIALSVIGGATSYDDHNDAALRNYLEDEWMESKEVLSHSVLDKIVKSKLRINMDVASDKSRIQKLFAMYHSLLQRYDIVWTIKELPSSTFSLQFDQWHWRSDLKLILIFWTCAEEKF